MFWEAGLLAAAKRKEREAKNEKVIWSVDGTPDGVLATRCTPSEDVEEHPKPSPEDLDDFVSRCKSCKYYQQQCMHLSTFTGSPIAIATVQLESHGLRHCPYYERRKTSLLKRFTKGLGF